MTIEAIQKELPKRAIIYSADTVLDDGVNTLSFIGDPNNAISTYPQALLYYAPAGTSYSQKSGAPPYKIWDKVSDVAGGAWVERGSGATQQPVGSADNTVDSQTLEGGAGTVGKAYYLNTQDTWLFSDKTIKATVQGQVGICSENNTVMFSGLISLPGHLLGVEGDELYVHLNGDLTNTVDLTIGEFIKPIGFVEDVDTIRIDIDTNFYELGEINESGGTPGGVSILEDRIGFGCIAVNEIKPGIKAYRTVPFNCTINGWYIESEEVGTITVDVMRDMILPSSLVGVGTKPSLVAQSSNSDASPDWSTLSLTEGDILVFNVEAGATAKNVVLTLDIESV